jgi:fused signal recognition particle receptor
VTTKPHVVLVVGVNGSGKTTTIGKLAAQERARGRSVMLVAADTFRAAAADQLAIWAQRAGAELVRHKEGADPAAVVFDGLVAAKARAIDVVFIDTAGRLQTKHNLMEELKKIRRVVAREVEGAPQETLLVLDATTGQNALSQAKLFHEATAVTGIVLTKLDGTAKGGIILAVMDQVDLPVKYIGFGEKVDQLRPFEPRGYVEALF